MDVFYRKTIDRAVSMLIDKIYPETEMVLDDDVIVLTNVDIRCTNDPGETDDSDEECDNELRRILGDESDFTYESMDDDMSDFIDDRPEEEMSEHSGDTSDNESCAEGEEDKEYDSEDYKSVNGSESESSESESENENGNGNKNDANSDSDTPNTPRKIHQTVNFVDSSSESEKDDSGESSDESDDSPKISPRKKLKLCNSSDDEPSGCSSVEDTNNYLNESPESHVVPIGNDANKQHVNKFGVYLLPTINGIRTCLRYHGRIGMKGIRGYCRKMTKKQFCDLINRKRRLDGFTRLNLLYVNARHLENRKPESNLEKSVRKLLIHLIDLWFPLGLPLIEHLDRALCLLDGMHKQIAMGKVPKLEYTNKFYALIPHQGDNRRRQRFKDIIYCDSKIEYVNKMKSAIDCLTEANRRRGINPLDYFIDNWIRVELIELNEEKIEYKILKNVVEKTQHANSSRYFRVANIFKVDNMNADENGDFSTNITHNHRYLLHFTFGCNILSILREGLKSAPKHIYSVNRFLGDGIYFWDAVANAGLNYKSLNTVYILVCRVALGNAKQVKQQYLRHDQKLQWDNDVDSIFCLGEKFSSSRSAEEDLNGAKIYCGQLEERSSYEHGYSLYNEYVIKNKQQAIVEFIIKLEKE
ncbi:poly [ADP-ribose] polymerase 1-like [Contarinia nasturtii]|uniref:poly [ADP-ribose] polymerase 1-like n=1 Tax=Contarinia nasturtii TaxID=265458 RepID=UPI0012D49212|nr:poly [ADP-ribose] polymerase 1-like [Contarinia nasturtii]